MPPDEELLLRIKELADRDGQIANLNQAVAERDGQIAALYKSTSCRIASSLRTVAHQVKRARRITELVMRVIRRDGGLKGILKKAVRLYRREGLAGIKRRFRIVATSGQPVIPEVARSIEIDYSLSVPFSFSVLPNSGLRQTAAIIHLFYEDLAGEFRSYLDNASVDMDIYISTTDSFRKNVIEKAFEGWSRGSIEVRVVPNRGRDIAPKLVSFRDIYERYTYVLHLHSKRSHHANLLESWRHFLLENLIGTKEVVQSVFQAFERNPSIGIIASQHFEPIRHWVNWDENFKTANQLASKMGFSINEHAPLDFPSGSMFWARSAALRPLLDLNLRTDEFDEERGQSDGTLAHAIERIYFHACEHAGYDWLKIARPELFEHTPAIVGTSRVSDLDSFFSRHLFRLLDPRGIEPRTVRPIPVERPASRLFDIVRNRVLGINLKVQPTTRVAIGLVTYNNRDDKIHSAIGAAHLSLQRAGVNTEGGLFILDNGSNTEAATSGNPFVVRLPSEGNIGFGAAHNRLMRAAFDAGAEIYIAINPDGVLHHDAVLALVQMAQAASGKALVEALRFPLEHPKPYGAVTLDTPCVSSACLAIPRLAFEDLGGFDENFFTYCKDVDISRRARVNGYALKTCPRALFLMASYRGFSTQFLGRLKIVAHLLSRLKQWWFGNDLRSGFSDRVLGFLRGETEASRKLTESSLRFHIDRPQLGLVNIVKDSYDISGWAVDLEAYSAVKVRFVVGQTIHKSYPRQREDVQRASGAVYELLPGTGFAIALALPVGVHWMRVEVEGLDGSWIPIRRALLLRIPGISRAQQTEPYLSYSAWTRLEQKRLKAEIPDIKRHIDVMVHKPTFTVVVDTRQGGTGLEDTIQSIRRQLYPFWDVRVVAGAAASSLPDDVKSLKDMSLSDIRGGFIVFMQSGQRLASNALYEFAAAINQRPDIDLIYGDEDSFAASGSRRDPFHKPGWSPDYLETFNYIGFPACFRTAIARGCFADVHVYDFVLRFTERTTRVLHVPKILGHGVEKLRVEEAALANAVALDIKALSGRLSRTGRRGSVYEHELHKGCYGVRLDLKRSPLVSVIIPTAGKTVSVGERQINLIENVIGQIRNRSTYKNIEIIVVDNGDLSPTQVRMLAEAECKRITYSDPVFNIAKKLNLGVSIANGELLLLMNDDIEILTPAWIERLLEHFEKPHVGVVGAKLLYPNEQTQHVGVIHNLGNPDHVRRRFPRNDAGYFFSTCGVRNYSAVTGACMMTPASIYREVGGYSDELAVCFNDVDFCMKVRRKGLWVVYTPSAELIHMESLSRVTSLDMGELAWHHQRWAAELVSDQFYNERFLTVEPPTFVPCVNQRML